MKNFFITFLLFWCPTLICRILNLHTEGSPLSLPDLEGFFLDAFASCFFSILVLICFKRRRIFALSIFLLLNGLVQIANFEHIKANRSLVDARFITYLFNGTFFEGSVTGGMNFTFIGFLLATPLVIMFLLRKRIRQTYVPYKFPVLIMLVGFFIFAQKIQIVTWHQSNVFIENSKTAWSFFSNISRPKDPVAKKPRNVAPSIQALFTTDLTGVKRWPLESKKAKNIILLSMEGIPQGLLNGQRYQMEGDKPKSLMPFLESLAKDHVSFPHTFSHQRQTNNGQYALLCGDFPNFAHTASKMTEYSEEAPEKRRECLPRFFVRHGYRTAYLQSAPISFMGKNHFMPDIGFQKVYDTKWLGESLVHAGWGADDKTFLEGAAKLIKELHADKTSPWFLNLMTSGTHHPYLIPKEWVGRSGLTKMEDAYTYLDEALSILVDDLKKNGILEDTLLVITSDEANGFNVGDPVAQDLTHNHIPSIIVSPDLTPKAVMDNYMQSDFALSLADYFDFTSEKDQLPFKGRSMFRHYETPRLIPFANVYLGRISMLWEDESLTICDNKMSGCSDYKGTKFYGPYVEQTKEPEKMERIKDFLSVNEIEGKALQKKNFNLIRDKVITFKSKNEEQSFFASPILDIEPFNSIQVSLKMKVLSGAIRFEHRIVDHQGPQTLHRFPRMFLTKGMHINWKYEYQVKEHHKNTELQAFVWNQTGEDTNIEIEEAVFTIKRNYFVWALPQVRQIELDMTGFNGEYSFDALSPGFLAWSDCVKAPTPAGRSAENCPKGSIAFGPYMTLPKEAKVQVVFKIASKGEARRVFIDIADNFGKSILKKGDIVEVGSSGPADIALDYTLQKDADKLETRLNLKDSALAGVLNIESARLVISSSHL